MSFLQSVPVFVPAVVIPLAAFGANWAYRGKFNYSQTAASDLLLAIGIFDGCVIASSETFEPFVRDAQLRSVIVGTHILLGVLVMFVWLFATSYGEPKLEDYYRRSAPTDSARFPAITFALCWMGVSGILILQIGYYFYPEWRGILSHD